MEAKLNILNVILNSQKTGSKMASILWSKGNVMFETNTNDIEVAPEEGNIHGSSITVFMYEFWK